MKETQKFLNWLNKPAIPLVEDGILGAKSKAEIDKALGNLAVEFAKRGWAWNKDFNFIGIRTDNDFDDKFEDWFVFTEKNTLTAIPCSTVAGLCEVWKGINNWVGGLNGVGVLCENQQVDYLVVEAGDTTFWNSYWTGVGLFLYQDKSVKIYRDNNGDGTIDKNVTQNGYFGINIHSWLDYELDSVTNLSSGCQVAKYGIFVSVVIPMIKKYARIENNQKRITYSLIQL